MARGGRRPGAGRPLGRSTKNKPTVRAQARASVSPPTAPARTKPTDIDALELKRDWWLNEFQLEHAKGEKGDKRLMAAALDKAAEAAEARAPYKHPKLRAVLLTEDEAMLRRSMDIGGLSDAELDQLERIAAKIAPARDNPSGEKTTRH